MINPLCMMGMMHSMELKKKEALAKNHIIFIILACCVYIVYAFYLNGFGTNAPVMMAFYSITSAQQGFIFTMQSIGALLMSVYLALHGERYNKINVFAAGTLMFTAASLAVGLAPPYILLIVLVMAGGAGYSALDIMLNSMIPELYPNQKNTLLPIAHAFFGTGAMITPILITTLVNPDIPSSFSRPFLLIGAVGAVIFTAFFIASRRVIPETPYYDMAALKNHTSGNQAEIFKTKKAWMFLIAGVMFFSFQLGIVSWLPSYCREIGLDFASSGAMLTAFFAGSLVMRFCGPIILKKMTARKAYILFGLFSAGAVAAALFTANHTAMTVLIAIGGFMQGSCVAFLFLMSTGAFPHRVASASSLITISVNAGAMTAPLWMGGLAELTGFRAPLLLVCALMVLSVLLIVRVGEPLA